MSKQVLQRKRKKKRKNISGGSLALERVLVGQLGQMRGQKKSQAWQCAALSPFRTGKWEKGMFSRDCKTL